MTQYKNEPKKHLIQYKVMQFIRKDFINFHSMVCQKIWLNFRLFGIVNDYKLSQVEADKFMTEGHNHYDIKNKNTFL